MKIYFEILGIILLFTVILFSGCVTNDNNSNNTIVNIIDNNAKISNKAQNNLASTEQIIEINPCDLLSKELVENILKEKVKDARLSDNFAPSGKTCSYFTDVKVNTRKASLTIHQNDIMAKEGIFDSSTKYFNNLKNAKISASNLSIDNLNYGDSSYFDGFDLHIIKGNNYLIIHVDSEKQVTNSSQEMEQKLANSRFELEKLVAEEIMKNLK